MKRTLKVVGLLVLGAVLGQLLLVGAKILQLTQKVKSPHFLMTMTLRSTAPHAMSNEELALWNDMREKIRHEQLGDVNAFIQITKDDVDFDVVPAKQVFAQGESILAEIRLKNVSNRELHVNEPLERRLTPEAYYYQDKNQFDHDISIDPLESTWMRTLHPGERLSIPTLILTTNLGPHKINYSLSVFQFDEQGRGHSPAIKRVSCSFIVQPTH